MVLQVFNALPIALLIAGNVWHVNPEKFKYDGLILYGKDSKFNFGQFSSKLLSAVSWLECIKVLGRHYKERYGCLYKRVLKLT
jgi:hypothetical protein